MKFLDSLQFTPKSLDVLSKTLEDNEFTYLVEPCTTSHIDLVRRKGVERFNETKLPSQDAFFNKLSGSSCSDIDYAHASRVWDAFSCETIADYHDVYLQLDVLLLAGFFEKFRGTCLDFYSLDPLHYCTTPGLALDAALRMSRVELELITDENIYNLIGREGISMISTRYARANNPSFPSTYDDKLPRQDLIYLDVNNLYGCAMSQFLPAHGFRLLSSDEITALELENLRDDSEDGYIYEVDLHYPAKLHNRVMYSPTQQSVFPESTPQKKLTSNLRDKTRYVVHYRNLKLYVQLGLVITKVYRVLTFKQSPWLKAYIDINTHHRSLSDNGFLRECF